jgi:hypothetical protein
VFATYLFVMLFAREEVYIHRGNLLSGVVVAVTTETVSIRGLTGISRTFDVSPDVASKDLPLQLTRRIGCGHRLGDVRVKDKVDLHLVPTARGDVVIGIGIYRRPGGTIPPAEDRWWWEEKYRLHNVANADQAREMATTVLTAIAPRFGRGILRTHP